MAAIMMYADTKKDVHTSVEIHYNECRHELTPRGEGASEGCRPKLPRWPFSISDCTLLRAPPWMGVWYGIRAESQAFFYNVLHFLTTVLQCACQEFSPVAPCASHRLALVSAPRQPVDVMHIREQWAKRKFGVVTCMGERRVLFAERCISFVGE
jgi:hypothetical protein